MSIAVSHDPSTALSLVFVALFPLRNNLPVPWGPHRKPGGPLSVFAYALSARVNACYSSVNGSEGSMHLSSVVLVQHFAF